MGARVFEAAEAIGEVGAVPQAVLDDVQMAACPLGRPLGAGWKPRDQTGLGCPVHGARRAEAGALTQRRGGHGRRRRVDEASRC